ncbi:MAG: Formiminotransferase-cyclodeaminase [Gaiellales bacterium]|jgi:formiminotetrahydrofolate cyclodeaminase|nr:Formiminotransferase-cyclodeaminase [Gaiellales bacterium]
MDELLTRVASADRTPAAGSAAAVTAELAAALVIKAARRSRDVWPEAGGAIAQASALALRLRDISATLEASYETAMQSLAEGDSDRIAAALPPAAQAALELARTSSDTAALALDTARHCDQTHHADMVVAAMLAAASAKASAHLVEINLLSRSDDSRVSEARRMADSAGEFAVAVAREDAWT